MKNGERDSNQLSYYMLLNMENGSNWRKSFENNSGVRLGSYASISNWISQVKTGPSIGLGAGELAAETPELSGLKTFVCIYGSVSCRSLLVSDIRSGYVGSAQRRVGATARVRDELLSPGTD